MGYKESDTTVGLSSLIRAGDTCFASVWTQSCLHCYVLLKSNGVTGNGAYQSQPKYSMVDLLKNH